MKMEGKSSSYSCLSTLCGCFWCQREDGGYDGLFVVEST